jgi:hypothetical protein
MWACTICITVYVVVYHGVGTAHIDSNDLYDAWMLTLLDKSSTHTCNCGVP